MRSITERTVRAANMGLLFQNETSIELIKVIDALGITGHAVYICMFGGRDRVSFQLIV